MTTVTYFIFVDSIRAASAESRQYSYQKLENSFSWIFLWDEDISMPTTQMVCLQGVSFLLSVPVLAQSKYESTDKILFKVVISGKYKNLNKITKI